MGANFGVTRAAESDDLAGHHLVQVSVTGRIIVQVLIFVKCLDIVQVRRNGRAQAAPAVAGMQVKGACGPRRIAKGGQMVPDPLKGKPCLVQ